MISFTATLNGPRPQLAAAGASRKSAAVGRKTRGRARAKPHYLMTLLQRWLSPVAVLLACIAVSAVAWWGVMELRRVPVQHIAVSGKLEHTSTDSVQELVRAGLVDGFLEVALGHIKQQLEQLPWVYSARVSRRWPDRLEIHIVEQLPIARWGDSGLLNHQGARFSSGSTTNWVELPRLLGPEGAERQMMRHYLHMSELLAPLGLTLTEVAQDQRGQIRVQLDQGFSLMVGSDQLVEKIQRFSLVYQQKLQHRKAELAVIDLRYPNGLAVSFSTPGQIAGIQKI